MVARRRGWWSLALVTLVLSAACTSWTGAPAGDSDYCARFRDRSIECAAPDEQRDVALNWSRNFAFCEQKYREPGEVEAYLDCVQRSTCDEYHRCASEVSARILAVHRKQRVAEAAGSGEGLYVALVDCRSGEIEDEEALRQCATVFEKGLAAGMKDLERARDNGLHSGLCPDLEDIAAKVSPEARGRAELLCKEVAAGDEASGALALARWFFNDDRLEMPGECDRASEALATLTTPWARARLQEVLKACYVDLGRKILQARVGEMRTCEAPVAQIYRAVERYDLKEPQLDAWIAKAKPKCQ